MILYNVYVKKRKRKGMENYASLKVRLDIRKALNIESGKEDLNLRDLTDIVSRKRLVEEDNLSNG